LLLASSTDTQTKENDNHMSSKKKTAVPATTPTSPTPASPAAPPSPPPTTTVVTGTANGSNHATKVDLQALYQAVIAGLLAFYAPTDTFLMKSGTFTRDELITQFQTFVVAIESTKASYQQWRGDIQAERALELVVAPLRVGVRGMAQARFGKDGVQLLQFGFTPAKVVQRTAESKVLAAARAKATRAARGTKGSKQKLEVQGTVTTVTIGKPAPSVQAASVPATPTAPAANAAATAPAPATAPAAPAVAAPAPTPAAPVAGTPQH
jgi:hypothetical protein